MIKFKRYYSAFRRYNRSKGFGIHSPFAFNFVLKVLRERSPYYAYDDIHAAHWEASRLSSAKERKYLISFKYAKMIFRTACHFNPQAMLQIGTSHGIASKALLSVSSSSHLYSYLGINYQRKIYESATTDIAHRITKFDDIASAIETYNSTLKDTDTPFILINHIDKGAKLVVETASHAISNGGVVIVCNINKNNTIKNSWGEIKSSMTHGMSFSNDKIGIIVGLKHLPLQHFSLWF